MKQILIRISILCVSVVLPIATAFPQVKIEKKKTGITSIGCKSLLREEVSGGIRSDSGLDTASKEPTALIALKGQPKVEEAKNKRLLITSKPVAKHTQESRSNCVEGRVLLKITFLTNGKVGKIKTVLGMPFGLTEQAIEAARKIRFEPAQVNGKPMTVSKVVEYGFHIY